LSEPAADGIVRPGHPIGNATRRPTFKNGALTDVREAVNICRTEWMSATAFDADDPRWLALFDYLETQATAEQEPALSFEIAAPPNDLTGGDAMAGQQAFNGRCVVCHGVNAVGTNRAPRLTGIDIPAEEIAERVRMSGRTDSSVYSGLTGGRMPFWAADRISDQQLRDVIAFIENTTSTGPGGGGSTGGEQRDCPSTHSKVGQITTLSTKFHGVSGTATIVDDCTIEVQSFNYDGNGIVVQMYAGLAGAYSDGFAISDNLINFPTGYQDSMLTLTLPEDKTLDDLDGISVWCVSVGVSFGDGMFASP